MPDPVAPTASVAPASAPAPTSAAAAPAAPASFKAKVMAAASGAPAAAPAPSPAAPAPTAAPPKTLESAPVAPVVAAPVEPVIPAASDVLARLRKGEITEEPVAKGPNAPPTDPNSREFQTWKELRSAFDEKAKEAAEFKRQLEETSGKIPKDYDEVVKARDTYQQQLAARDLTQRPEFIREVQQPLNALFGQVRKTAEAAKVDYRALVQALDAPDDLARDNAIHALFRDAETEVSPATIARVVIQAGEIAALRNHGDELLKSAPEVMSALKAEEEKASETKRAQAKEEHQRAGNVALQWLEGEGILGTKELKDAAREGLNQQWEAMKPVPRAYALIAASVLDGVVAEGKAKDAKLTEIQKENASLKLQLGKLGAAGPSSVTPTEPVSAGAPKTLREKIAAGYQ